MKIKDINPGENEQKMEAKNEYIPGSSEKKRASVMYLFFGIIVSLSKKEFSPFELYHLKQSIGLWILILPVVLISFIPLIRIIGIVVLVVLLGILGWSFANAFNGKYFNDSKNVAFTLPAGIGGWFLDLFELGIKSTGEDEKQNSSDSLSDQSSDIEKDIADTKENISSDDLQTKGTSLEEDVEALDKQEEIKKDDEK